MAFANLECFPIFLLSTVFADLYDFWFGSSKEFRLLKNFLVGKIGEHSRFTLLFKTGRLICIPLSETDCDLFFPKLLKRDVSFEPETSEN